MLVKSGVAGRAQGGFLGLATVRNAADLAALRRLRERRRLHVALRVPGLAPDTARQWEARVNSNLHDCGCRASAQAMMVALAGSVIWQWLFSGWGISRWPAFLLQTILIVFLAGGVGKFLALAWADARLRTTIKRLRDFEESVSKSH
jgi:hypothetical protein